MNAAEFRVRAKEMVDYVADYLETIQDRTTLSQVKPGYLKDLIPTEAPAEPEKWEHLLGDIERAIMPGVTHWQSPNFHAYYPTGVSYPSIMADMLSDAIGCVGFSWIASPASTELEMITLDWLAKLCDLPQQFLMGGNGGGVIQGSASEATLVALLVAKNKIIQKLKQEHPSADESEHLAKLIFYCSDQAHSSVARAGLLAYVKCHVISSDEFESMRGDSLRAAIKQDRANGLVPFFCVATLGTTSSCAFDELSEIGHECAEQQIWLHIDASYAGSAFICPEFRPLLNGVEFADSFNFNPSKWLLVNFDCSAMWFKDGREMANAFHVDLLITKHKHEDTTVDYRHWGIAFGRRFRSLKLWFVMRLYGVSGLQAHIRKQVSLAKEFEQLVRADSRFVVSHKVLLGLVCFQLKNDTGRTKLLLTEINADGRIYLTGAQSKNTYFLRFVVCSSATESKHVIHAWSVIQEMTDRLLNKEIHSSANEYFQLSA